MEQKDRRTDNGGSRKMGEKKRMNERNRSAERAEVDRGKRRGVEKNVGGKRKAEKTLGEGSRRCEYVKKCGGCQYLYLSYEEQLKKKEDFVRRRIKELGGEAVRGCKWHPIIGMEDPWHYRNKVTAVFSRDRKGKVISGVYQEGSHTVVPVENCLIEDELADRIIGTVRGLLPSFKIKVYDEDTQYGLLRYVLVRRAFATGEVMVVLVTASPIFPSKNNFTAALRKAHPEITTVVQNINMRTDSLVLGNRQQVLYGKGYIEDVLCGLRFRISPQSFYQVNPVQTEKLYGKAIELAGLTGNETVVDAYCGIGTIGLVAAPKAGKVIAVELNGDAVKDAVTNGKLNGIKNVRFYRGDAGEFLRAMAAEGERADVVFMDPPRNGSSKEFLEALRVMRPEKVVYISCNPETLGRDVKVLGEMGYGVREGWVVDLFGWTTHVEVVIMMTYCGSDKKNRG